MSKKEKALDLLAELMTVAVPLSVPLVGLIVCAMLFMSEAERCSKPAAGCTTVGELIGVR